MTLLATDKGGETDKGSSWASLPELCLWMIKDKLDIFDNWRLAAVCRHWWSASTSDPKILQRVGDGLPWIWQPCNGFKLSSREIISVTKERKLTFDMPELASARVLFSKENWLFLKRFWNSLDGEHLLECVILLNPLTKVKIKLPCLSRYGNYSGYFTTQDGYPHRIFILFGGGGSVTIGETHPGDQVWINHVFFADEPRFTMNYFLSLIVIGDVVYCKDCDFRNLAFNLVDNSWKLLPETKSSCGYFVDLDGKLVFIEHSEHGEHVTYMFYRYNDDDSSWEVLNNNEVMDTSWFFFGEHCIVAKGKGLKVYSITETLTFINRRGIKIKRVMKPEHRVTHVEVHDLVTGSRETLDLPFKLHHRLQWVDLGSIFVLSA